MPIAPADANPLAAIIGETYTLAETEIIRRIARLTAQGIQTPDWLDRLLTRTIEAQAEAAEVLAGLRNTSDKAFRQVFSDAYRLGRRSALLDLGLSLRSVDPRPSEIDILVRTASKMRKEIGVTVVSSMPDVIAQINVKAALSLTTGTVTRIQAAAQAIDSFATAGVDGIVDKRGRTWEIQTYAEMATRTMAGQAAIGAHIQQLQDLGEDLVIVSDVKEECPRCRPYEGKVLCTSDRPTQYGTYKSAVADGLQHPNCRHTISIFLPGITEVPTHITADPEGAKLRAKQRDLERRVRKAKQALEGILELNDPAETAKAKAKVKNAQSVLKTFITDNDRPKSRARTSLQVR